ncbi:MAG: glycosyltransferase family 4 protein [Verrucomicrobiota bacterium]
MKILVLSNLYPPHYVGGYELHCQTIVEALRARGHVVQVLTSNHGLDQEETFQNNSDTERSLKIHGMFGHPWLNIFRLRHQEQHNNLKLRDAIRRFQPELVYVWNLSGLSKSMVFTLQAQQIPTVFVVCDHWIARSAEGDVWLNWWNAKNVSMKHKLIRSVLTTIGLRDRWNKTAPTNSTGQFVFQRIYFCSRALRDFTAAAGFNVQHAAAIYCPINIHRFSGEPRTARQPLQRLLYVGRLTEDKGVMTALRAMSLVKDKFAGELVIYGHGENEYEQQLKKFTEKNKLPVTFANACRPEQMPAVYNAHDALLFTSEWAEPFALTPLEAMASGLPVIGTTTGGSGELLRHGENSLTYTAGNAEELARRILELNADDTLRARIAIAGYCEVRERFEESKIVGEIESYLTETLKTWRPIQLADFK